MDRTSGEWGNSPKLGTRLRKVDKLADLKVIQVTTYHNALYVCIIIHIYTHTHTLTLWQNQIVMFRDWLT